MWAIVADKAGDNRQVDAVLRGIERELGWPCETRRIRVRDQWRTAKPPVEPTLSYFDLDAGDPLEPPWPDLVVTIGRRPSSAALWVRGQSRGHTRVVLVGKPSGPIEDYDLVVASAEVVLPPVENVVHIDLPLMEVDRARLNAAAEVWSARLKDLVRPLTAVLVGGPTWPFVFDRDVARTLGDTIASLTEEGGAVFVTTSRRTPADVADFLQTNLPARARLFRWKDARSDDNPYEALLALADRFVVTADSISMQVEVARLARPMKIVPLPMTWRGRLDTVRRRVTAHLCEPEEPAGAAHLRAGLARAGYRLGLVRQTRDFARLHARLIERGLAAPLDAPWPTPAAADVAENDLEVVLRRIRGLFAS